MKAILLTNNARCEATVEAQKRHADLLLESMRQQVHRELEHRGGLDKPCPTDITAATLEGTQKLVFGMSLRNSCIIRSEAMEMLSTTFVETVEYSHSQSL